MTFTNQRRNGALIGSRCDQCREPIDARTERQLDIAKRAHRCPARPSQRRTTP